jgi:hypothetical protein
MDSARRMALLLYLDKKVRSHVGESDWCRILFDSCCEQPFAQPHSHRE